MENKQYQWVSFDDGKLFGQSWCPDSEPKAVINFVHGIGEHSTRYKDWMPFFTKAGFAVFAIEYRGHGHSFGKRGYIKDYEDLMKDIDVLFVESDKAYPNLPKFLYGHSLGGNLATNYTMKKKPDIKGLIATSPWFRLTKEPPSWQLGLVKFIHKYAPGLIITSNLKTTDITQNQDVIDAYDNDELVHSKISLELLLSAHNNGQWVIDHAKDMPVPFFLAHGAEDKITAPKGSEAFYANNPETTLKIWDGMLHELHNEPIRAEHAQSIIEWLNKQLA